MYLFYKIYPYAPGATLVSALGSLTALGCAAGAFFLFSGTEGVLTKYVLAGLLAVLAVLSFIFLTHVIPNKISEKVSQKNITTKAGYAYNYCRQHPEAYESLAAVNPEFAQKYMMNEKGKVVKRK